MANRREQALDAAIRVLGTQGSRGLTHRAVDAEAGLAAGSTSNYFRSRDALVAAVLDRATRLDVESFTQLAGQVRAVDAERFAGYLADALRRLADEGRTLSLARYAIFLEAALRPPLRARVAAGFAELTRLGEGWLDRLGSTDPAGDTRRLLMYLDGLLMHQLAHPEPEFDPRPAITALLRGMLAAES
jgi:DNA-binding transcriptional regulator YbjK